MNISKIIVVILLLFFIMVVTVGALGIIYDDLVTHLPEKADAAVVKIDPAKNIMVVSWSVSEVDAYQSHLLCAIYSVDPFGDPSILSACEITKPTGEYVLDLNEVAKGLFRKGDYYVMIIKLYIDERGEQQYIIVDDKRTMVTDRAKDTTEVKKLAYDPAIETTILPVKAEAVVTKV